MRRREKDGESASGRKISLNGTATKYSQTISPINDQGLIEQFEAEDELDEDQRSKSCTDLTKTEEEKKVKLKKEPIGIFALPPITSSFALLIICLFITKEYFQFEADLIQVNFDVVFLKYQFWKLFYAHYFHFGYAHLLLNVLTLMSIGRTVEKEIRPLPMFFLIPSLGVLSNTLFSCMSLYICKTVPFNSSYGLSNVIFSLRIARGIFRIGPPIHDSKPYLIFGFFPLFLPSWWTPWQPVVEVLFMELVFLNRCIAGHLSGILSGFSLFLVDYSQLQIN